MKKAICFISTIFISASVCSTVFAQPSEKAKKILGPWDGEWQGVFRIFSADGLLLDSLHVHQKYDCDGEIQKGIINVFLFEGRYRKISS